MWRHPKPLGAGYQDRTKLGEPRGASNTIGITTETSMANPVEHPKKKAGGTDEDRTKLWEPWGTPNNRGYVYQAWTTSGEPWVPPTPGIPRRGYKTRGKTEYRDRTEPGTPWEPLMTNRAAGYQHRFEYRSKPGHRDRAENGELWGSREILGRHGEALGTLGTRGDLLIRTKLILGSLGNSRHRGEEYWISGPASGSLGNSPRSG